MLLMTILLWSGVYSKRGVAHLTKSGRDCRQKPGWKKTLWKKPQRVRKARKKKPQTPRTNKLVRHQLRPHHGGETYTRTSWLAMNGDFDSGANRGKPKLIADFFLVQRKSHPVWDACPATHAPDCENIATSKKWRQTWNLGNQNWFGQICSDARASILGSKYPQELGKITRLVAKICLIWV